jgi:hypothetical protein
MASDLATTIRDRIRSGALPPPPNPLRSCSIHKGSKRPCDGCDNKITEDQIEYELELGDTPALHFHDKCFTDWRNVRAERLHK